MITAFAQMKFVHDYEIPQVNHSLGYLCQSDKCNDEITLKRILRSLVIEDKFAQELTPLLKIISPFDGYSAACYDFNNYTRDCPPVVLDTCQRCQISIHKQSSSSQGICATCPFYYIDNFNSLSHEITFSLKNRTSLENTVKLNCQLKSCNSIENVNRVDKASNITFDFVNFFLNELNNTYVIHLS